jgi:glycerophosphoryl diester phosphodiesterase
MASASIRPDTRTTTELPKARALKTAGVLAGAAGVVYLRTRAHRPRLVHPVFEGGPLLIAHRGGAALAPENTLPAFMLAAEAWAADMIELDVRATRDGVCVVIHDPTVNRTTDGDGAVADLTLEELRRFDAGYRYTPDGGTTFPFRGRGITIPTFDEVLEALPHMRLTVEVKTAAAQEALFDAIERHVAGDRIVAAGMDEADRNLFGRHTGAVSASAQQVRSFYILHRLRLDGFVRFPADAVQVPEHHHGRRVVSPAFVRSLHRQGVQVHVWTVNDDADMRRLLAWGVDGLVTDRPDLLGSVLGEFFGRDPAPGLRDAHAMP